MDLATKGEALLWRIGTPGRKVSTCEENGKPRNSWLKKGLRKVLSKQEEQVGSEIMVRESERWIQFLKKRIP